MPKINNKKFAILLLITGAFFSLTLAPVQVAADDAGDYGLEGTIKVGNVKDALKQDKPEIIVGRVIGAILAFVGILFLCLMIYGGIIWMMARGNESEVEKAKNIIISAIFGLIIVLAAYAITAFIGQQIVGKTN